MPRWEKKRSRRFLARYNVNSRRKPGGERALDGRTEKSLNNFPQTSLTPRVVIIVSLMLSREWRNECLYTYDKTLFFNYCSSFFFFSFPFQFFSPDCRYRCGRKLFVVVTRWNCKWWARCKKYRDRQPRDIGIFKDQRVSDPKKPVI